MMSLKTLIQTHLKLIRFVKILYSDLIMVYINKNRKLTKQIFGESKLVYFDNNTLQYLKPNIHVISIQQLIK